MSRADELKRMVRDVPDFPQPGIIFRDITPLLGQSFHRHFTYKFTPESGHLVMSRVEGLEPQATTKPARPARNTAKARSRAGRSRAASGKAATGDGPDGNRPD